MSARLTDGGGKAGFNSSIVSAMICETARLRNHLWFEGITYQGASAVLVASIASSNALTSVVPKLALRVVGLADLPIARGIVQTLLEAGELFLPADMEE